ncbi:transposase, partial [Streptomyces globisporus]|uniref:IS110 family transposase n=1 Tax=Streptomyces globisporus TaxID=1908 RepID=UPI00373AF4AB
MIDTGDIDVFLGLDVGKGEHQATAVTPAGKKAFDKRLPHTEPKLRWLYSRVVTAVVHGFGRRPDPRSGDVHEFCQHRG